MDRRSTQIDASDGAEWQMAITLETFSELCGTNLPIVQLPSNPKAQYSSHVHRASSTQEASIPLACADGEPSLSHLPGLVEYSKAYK